MDGKRYHVHIVANTPEELKSELQELAHILTGLREHQKAWHNNYGSQYLKGKVYWENKADQWINYHKIIIEE